MRVQLDQYFVLDEHVRFVCAKYLVKYAKKLLPQETLSYIYRGVAEPCFLSCSSVRGSCEETKLLTLQKLQNHAARRVTNSSYDALADALIERLYWPAIAELIKQETATMAYKSLNSLALTYLSNIFSGNFFRDTVYLRNSETDLQVLLFKTDDGQNSFAYRGAHLWNSLAFEA